MVPTKEDAQAALAALDDWRAAHPSKVVVANFIRAAEAKLHTRAELNKQIRRLQNTLDELRRQ